MNFVNTIFSALTGTSTQELSAQVTAAEEQITLAVEAIIVLIFVADVLLLLLVLKSKRA